MRPIALDSDDAGHVGDLLCIRSRKLQDDGIERVLHGVRFCRRVAESLADGIPARNFQCGDSAHLDLPTVRVNVAREPSNEQLGLKDLQSHDEGFGFVNRGLYGLGEVAE